MKSSEGKERSHQPLSVLATQAATITPEDALAGPSRRETPFKARVRASDAADAGDGTLVPTATRRRHILLALATVFGRTFALERAGNLNSLESWEKEPAVEAPRLGLFSRHMYNSPLERVNERGMISTCADGFRRWDYEALYIRHLNTYEAR